MYDYYEKHHTRWTDDEIEILKENYPKMGGPVSALLPWRSRVACVCMARKLGLVPPDEVVRVDAWTEEELNLLKTRYPKEGRAVFELLKGKRTIAACSNMVCKLGLTVEANPKFRYWTNDEDIILEAHVKKFGQKNLENAVPGRTAGGCKRRAKLIGLI